MSLALGELDLFQMTRCPKCSKPISGQPFLCECGYEFDGTEPPLEALTSSEIADLQSSATNTKFVWATIMGVITAFCTLGWFISYAITVSALNELGDSAPPFYPGIISLLGLVLTLPPALICTIISLILVGPRRSKLAWISLSIYFLPFIIVIILVVSKK